MALDVRALCTVDDVKGVLPGFTPNVPDPDADPVLERLVNHASELVRDWCGREFVSLDATLDTNGTVVLPAGNAFVPASTRVFDVTQEMVDWYQDELYRQLYLGDLHGAPASVTTKDALGTIVENVASGQYVLLGGDGERWRDPRLPVCGLWFKPTGAAPSKLATSYTIEVAGVWGWPVIPEPVKEATIETAMLPYAKDVDKFSATFQVDARTIVLPRAIPDRAKGALKRYRASVAA